MYVMSTLIYDPFAGRFLTTVCYVLCSYLSDAIMPEDTFPQQVPWSNPSEIHANRRQKDPRNLAPKGVVALEDKADVHAGGRVADSVVAQGPSMPDRDEVPPGGHDASLATSSRQNHGPSATVMGFDDRVPRGHDAGLVTSSRQNHGACAAVMGFDDRSPGVVVVPGIDASPRSEEAHEDNQSVEQSPSTSTIRVMARVIDETEEHRILREQLHQVLEERDHERHENTATLNDPDVEYGHAVVAPILPPIHSNSEERDGSWHGAGRKRLAIGAVLVIVAAAVAVTLTLIFLPDPTPSPTPPPAPNVIPPNLTTLISDASFDGGVALSKTSTPQNKALDWLAGNVNLDTYSDEKKIQRYALATLYYSTGGGEAWDRRNLWLTDANECGDWDGLTPECSSDLAVSLKLNDGLEGRIPDEIALLSHLCK
jgi:hypothetical protein